MAGAIDDRLAELGITLPEPVAPVAAYVPFVQAGSLIFVSGQIPLGPDGLLTGHLTSADHTVDGSDPTEGMQTAIAAARLCALNLLAQVKAATGDLDRVSRVVKLTGFVSADASFQQHPQVINAASTLMADVFGEAGQHSRAAVGASGLPLGSAVEVEGVFKVS